MAKRTVEVFTAGCGLCNEAVETIRGLVCDSCDLQIHDMKSEAGATKAKRYGVTRVPSVVVNGQVADCCRQGGVDEATLRGLGVGVRT